MAAGVQAGPYFCIYECVPVPQGRFIAECFCRARANFTKKRLRLYTAGSKADQGVSAEKLHLEWRVSPRFGPFLGVSWINVPGLS